MQATDSRRPQRQDTFDLRDQISPDSTQMQMQAHADAAAGHYEVYGGADDEEGYSIMEHDSDGEEQDEGMYEDDLSSELSIPDESINFDLVYSLHSFAATVEGQANVVKGDSLILMDDSNSYWWLVKVLKTQEVGYIPAENIETPFERLARLNKHRNVDLASATELEKTDSGQGYSRLNAGSRSGNRRTPSPRLAKAKSVLFNASFPVHRYLPAVWNEEDEEEDDNMEWDDVAYIGEDPGLADEERERELAAMEALSTSRTPDTSMEDSSRWNTEMTIEEMQVQARARQQQQQQQLLLQQQQQQQQPQSSQSVQLPNALMPGGGFGQQLQQPQQNQRETLTQQQVEQQQQAMEARKAPGTTTERPTPQPVGGLYVSAMEKERERQQQEEAALRAKRRAEEEATAAEEARKRSKPTPSPQGPGVINPVSSASPSTTPSKLRKDPKGDKDRDADSEDSNGGKKKKGSVFRGLFGRKDKDKDKEKEKDKDKSRAGGERGTSIGSIGSQGSLLSLESSERDTAGRISEESRPGQLMPPQPPQQLLQQRQQLQLQQQQQQQQQPQQPQLQPQPQPQQPEAQGQQQPQQQFSTPERPTAASSALSSLSPHASQLRQKDMQQQALYQQYLNRSPSSPPEAQPSYGLQSASALMSSSAFRGGAAPGAAPGARAGSPAMNPSVSGSSNLSNVSTTTTSTSSSVPSAGSSATTSTSNNTNNTALGPPYSTPRQRPGSLIFNTDGQGPGVPDLSVIRVFAGRNLQTEATFKTVLLNASTTAAELVKQAIQRFRLPPSEGLGSSDPYGSANFDSSTGVGGGNVSEGWANEYYLTVKRVEGGVSAILRPTERPLVVFESLVLQALQEAADAAEEEERYEDENGFSNLPPRVKRSSVGSISSVASNLSMHSAIRRLPMNDFTDDSAVKFYLNRRTSEREREKNDGPSIGGGYVSVLGGGVATMDGEGSDRGGGLQYGLYGDDDEVEDHTIVAEASPDEFFSLGEGDVSISSTSSSLGMEVPSTIGQGLRYLSALGSSSNVPPERFSSPSLRFPLQLVIHPSDLPDDMVFHPYTEAIVPRDTLPSSSGRDGGSSAPFRRKVFIFPKNVTVAEVIELGLERFGILEGVVDGGDEVEDKFTKRRSTSRVRYGLCVDVGTGQERELVPMSRVTDAFPRPPAYKTQVPNFKRRSVDSTNLLGNIEDVSPDDPVFILRRATAYRNSTSRHRMSAPLDEIALQQLHHQRDSTASSTGSEGEDKSSKGTPSRQEIIAAQRAATRANQRAIVSAQSNSVRGMDVLLPNNAVLRSGRFDSSDHLRYSYVEPDGETYDISDIVAEEWREHNRQDVLAGVVGKNRSAVDSEKLDRVLDKIRSGKIKEREREKRTLGVTAHGGGAGGSADMRSIMSLAAVDSLRSTSPSEYSLDDRATAAQASRGDGHSRTGSASSFIGDGRMLGFTGRPGTATPTGNPSTTNISGSSTPTGKLNTNVSKRNPSIAAVLSESPTNMDTPTMGTNPLPKPSGQSQSQSSASSSSSSRHGQTSSSSRSKSSMSSQGSMRRPIIPKDEFGIDHMMAVIECKAALRQDSPTSPEKQSSQSFAKSSALPPLDPVDAILFGRPIDVESLHPLVRDVYAGAFKQLEDMDKLLDEFMGFNSIPVS